MHIWVDADACPLSIKKILYKAANRTQTLITFVSNQHLIIPPSPFLKTIRVLPGFNNADNEIVARMSPGDLVITADIPLADLVVVKGGTALNPRGELYTFNNIKQRLSIRDLNEQLRSSGIQTSSQAKLSQRQLQAFANNLDKILTKIKRTHL